MLLRLVLMSYILPFKELSLFFGFFLSSILFNKTLNEITTTKPICKPIPNDECFL